MWFKLDLDFYRHDGPVVELVDALDSKEFLAVDPAFQVVEMIGEFDFIGRRRSISLVDSSTNIF